MTADEHLLLRAIQADGSPMARHHLDRGRMRRRPPRLGSWLDADGRGAPPRRRRLKWWDRL